MKFNGFHGNPLCDFKEWGYAYNNTHISTATHLGLLNMVQKYSLDIAV